MLKFIGEFWLSLVLYGLFGGLLSYGGIAVSTQPFIFFGLLTILVVVDIRSHNEGLNKGVNIMKEVYLQEMK